ncbi:MAG: hypothetical protein ACK4IK_09975 [Bacteroidia bacterium]
MKKTLSLIIAAAAFIAISVSVISCSKERREFKKEDGQVSRDNKEIQSSIDDVTNEANRILSDNSLMSGKGNENDEALAYLNNICGYTVDTTQRPQGILIINFDGTTNCNGRIRAGQVKLTLENYVNGARWRDTGAVVKVEYINYKVTRVSDNKSLTFNGIKNITNVSGGNAVLLILGFQNSLVHRVVGNNIQVKFDDGSTATFNLARKWTHTWSNNVYTVKGEGEGSQNGKNNLENWGTTRDGDNFTSQVLEPVIWNSTCGAHKPVSGKLDIVVDAKDFSFLTTFGVDNSGNVVTGSCPWGLKVEWTYKNKTGTKLYPYN